MSKEILLVVESVSNEKGVGEEVIFEAMELALATAAKKRYQEEDVELRVSIDRSSGEYETFRYWDVVSDEAKEFPGCQLTLSEVKSKDVSLGEGDRYEIAVESAEFGRIAAQAAKQVIVQKVRDAERLEIIKRFRPSLGQLVSGSVKKVTREFIIVDLGDGAEASLPRRDLLQGEIYLSLIHI